MKMNIAIKRFVANKMKDIQSGISLRKILTYYNSNHFIFLSLQMFNHLAGYVQR